MKPMTYGILPSREEFEEAFAKVVGRDAHRETVLGAGLAHTVRGDPRFHFANDPRVGTCELTCSELWGELEKAQLDWGNPGGTTCDDDAGQWCSDVLGVLGFEWI